MPKEYITPGQEFNLTVGYSEVACYMKIAGTRMKGILTGNCVQLLDLTGNPFSFPILTGEAGLYQDQKGYYINSKTDTSIFATSLQNTKLILETVTT